MEAKLPASTVKEKASIPTYDHTITNDDQTRDRRSNKEMSVFEGFTRKHRNIN